jgi:hypothetical protein
MEFDSIQGALAEGLRHYDASEFFTAREARGTVWLETHGLFSTYRLALRLVVTDHLRLGRNFE